MKKIVLLCAALCVAFAAPAQELMADVQSGESQAVTVTDRSQTLQIGDRLPQFSLDSETYGQVSTADLKGKVVLVSLFATWCGPCQLELAEVESELWPKYKDNDDFVLLVIGREHTEAQLKAYNERKKFSFPLYPDPERKVFSLFAEKSIPRAYLFGKDGKLAYTSLGYLPEEFDKLMIAVEEALK